MLFCLNNNKYKHYVYVVAISDNSNTVVLHYAYLISIIKKIITGNCKKYHHQLCYCSVCVIMNIEYLRFCH